MIIVTVLYPKTADSRFDFDYYLQSHTPLVKSRFTQMGLENIRLLKGSSSLDGAAPSFAMIAELQFSAVQQLQDALAKHGVEILGDIPKFTNVQPVIQINEPV